MEIETRIALNSWTLDTTPLELFFRIARETGYSAVEVRAIDFKRCRESHAAEADLRSSGLAVSSLGADGILVQPGMDEQEEWFRNLERTTILARSIGCDTIMVSTGMENPTSVAAAGALLSAAGDIAAGAGLRLAYEFNAFHPSLSSLRGAIDLVEQADRPNIGLALDAYHLQQSRGFDLLPAIPPDKLFCIQISDVPSPREDSPPPLNRLPPGEGIVNWNRFFAFLDAVHYGGFVAFEAPNPTLWAKDAVQVARAGLTDISALWRAAGQVDGSRS